MALIRCDFFSEALGVSTSMTVILPQATETQIGMTGRALTGDHPTLYLLHGLSDDDTAWLRRTSIERYVSALGLAVVMPQVGRSFYIDSERGGDYWTFLSEELPEVARSFFHLSDRREDTFVAGLSMGGYGAMKWALRHPDRFAAAVSMSGAMDIAALVEARDPLRVRLWDTVFPDRSVPADDDLMDLLRRAKTPALPALSLYCGTEDHLYDHNVRFRDVAAELGVPLAVDFGPGEHEWGYWDMKIQDFLASLRIGVEDDAPASTKG